MRSLPIFRAGATSDDTVECDATEQRYISRLRALRLGEPHYLDPGAPPCNRGHTSIRVAITNLCLTCKFDYLQAEKPVQGKRRRRKFVEAQ